MSKYLVVAAALALAACGPKTEEAPAADTTTVAPVPPPVTDTMPPDTTKVDTTKAM
ncbi:MAG TPA: hypothetical protein VFN96_07860 [Gemmatimonadales bacterium]|nr:hypothetical protein [Gemmatimonadales bacterium]